MRPHASPNRSRISELPSSARGIAWFETRKDVALGQKGATSPPASICIVRRPLRHCAWNVPRESRPRGSELMTQIRSTGVHIHALSGKVNLRVRDPFDEIKVVVKRGQVDWVHIVPVSSVGLTQDCAHQNCQVVSRGASKKYSLECRQSCRIHVVDVQGDLSVVGHRHCAPSCQVRVTSCDQCALVESRHGWSTSGSQFQGKVEHAGS